MTTIATRIVALVPKGPKERLKGWRKRLRLVYVRRWRAFGPDDLLAALRRLGITPGDVLMVHSSFDRFAGFSGKPTDVLRVLQDAVGPTGTLLMPTLPFTGTAVEYVSRGEIFDVRRTPSRVGLLTELFRRSPGVVRSVHPTHLGYLTSLILTFRAVRQTEARSTSSRLVYWGRLETPGGFFAPRPHECAVG